MTKIALIGEFHDAGKEILKRNNINYIEIFDYTLDNLKKELADCDGIGIRTAKLPKEVLTHCAKLKIVARHGVGYDSVDIEFLNEKRIPLAITGSSNAVSVAEHVITMFLALSRRIIDCHNLVKNGEKFFEVPVNYNGRTISEGKKIRYYHIFSIIFQMIRKRIFK